MLAWALPSGANASQMFEQPRKAYVLMGIEPEFDCANPQAAVAALKQASLVVYMSAFKHAPALEYADVLLPIAPYTETAGTFVNIEGRVQSFNGVVKARGDARPAWKVLRVLGNVLNLDGFAYQVERGDSRRSAWQGCRIHLRAGQRSEWRFQFPCRRRWRLAADCRCADQFRRCDGASGACLAADSRFGCTSGADQSPDAGPDRRRRQRQGARQAGAAARLSWWPRSTMRAGRLCPRRRGACEYGRAGRNVRLDFRGACINGRTDEFRTRDLRRPLAGASGP
jgi:hypothetical protein